MAQLVKNPVWEAWVQPLGWDNLLKEGVVTHPSILAWRVSMDRRAWQATVHGVTESDAAERLRTAQCCDQIMFTTIKEKSTWILFLRFTEFMNY